MGRFTVFIALAALTVASATFSGSSPAVSSQTDTLVIHGGRLFDGTGATVIEDGVVLIEGGRIVATGSASEVEIPLSASRIDAAGGLIMPGVIDSHVHLTEPLVKGDILTPWLRAGVTTLVDNGTARDGATFGDVVIEDGIALLRILIDSVAEKPPRVLVAGPILTAPGGYPTTRSSGLGAQPVIDAGDARRIVASLAGRADVTKVAIEAGFALDYYEERGWPVLDVEILTAIVDSAHEYGLLARAHVSQEGELAAAVDAGFDVAAHTPIERLSDEILKRAADAGMIFVTTANIWSASQNPVVAENVSRFARFGGQVALGTDFPFQPGSQMPVAEMQLLIDGGMTPEQVLVSATKGGAAAVGREGDLGTLEPGKLADIIVIDGKPLSDIRDMANVGTVILEGKIVVGTIIEAQLPRFPDAGGGPVRGDRLAWPFYLAGIIIAAGTLAVILPFTRRRRARPAVKIKSE